MQLFFADRQSDRGHARLVLTDPTGQMVPIAAARQSGRRVLLCMYGPDVELLAAPARQGHSGRRRAAESVFPDGGAGKLAVIERRVRAGGGRESAVLVTPREILREYRQLLPGARLVAPSSILLELAEPEALKGRSADLHGASPPRPDSPEDVMILATARWFTLLRLPTGSRGRRSLDARSDCVESPSELPAAVRRALNRLAVADDAAGAGGAGPSRRMAAFALGGGAGRRLAEALPDTPVRELPALLPDLMGRLRGDFPSRHRRSLRRWSILGGVVALPLLGVLPGLVLPPAGEGAPMGSARSRLTAVSGTAGRTEPTDDPSPAAPAETAGIVAVPERRSRGGAHGGAPPETAGVRSGGGDAQALPEGRFHFAGRGRDAEGRAIWYFVDGETRRVVTVPGREDSYDPTVRN